MILRIEVYAFVFILGMLACGFQAERGNAAALAREVSGGALLELPWCELMYNEAREGGIVDELRSIAFNDLSSRKSKLRFRFVRAIAGPLEGQLSLTFVNLSYSDQYDVYVALIRDKSLEHIYTIGAPFHPDWECKDETDKN